MAAVKLNLLNFILLHHQKKRNPWHLENIKVTLGAISRRGTCLCTVLSNRSGKEVGGMREENIGHSCWHLGKHSWCLLPFSPWLHCTGTLEKSQLRSHSRGAQMPPAQYSVKRHSFLFALFVLHSSHLNPLREDVAHPELSLSLERRSFWQVKRFWSSPPISVFLRGSRIDALVDENMFPRMWETADSCLKISLFCWPSGCYCRNPKPFHVCTAQRTATKYAVSTSTLMAFQASL